MMIRTTYSTNAIAQQRRWNLLPGSEGIPSTKIAVDAVKKLSGKCPKSAMFSGSHEEGKTKSEP